MSSKTYFAKPTTICNNIITAFGLSLFFTNGDHQPWQYYFVNKLLILLFLTYFEIYKNVVQIYDTSFKYILQINSILNGDQSVESKLYGLW